MSVLIEPADLNRLAAEVMASDADGDIRAWAEREGITMEALEAVFRAGDRKFVKHVAAGDDPLHILNEIVGATFWLAWEAHKEYAGGGA